MNKAMFITARLGSSRLPNKHLLKINNKYCIEYVIERISRSKKIKNIVLCTTNLEQDEKLCDIAKKYNINYFCGSVNDKLKRWYDATKKYNVDFFITVDADNLFYDPNLIDLSYEQYIKSNADLIEWDEENMICGVFTYAIKTEALKIICETKNTDDTEMMWVFFKNGPFVIEKLKNIPNFLKRPDIRATLDYKEDFIFFEKIYNNFKNNNFDISDVINYLDKNPEIININKFRHVEWKKNQENIINKIIGKIK